MFLRTCLLGAALAATGLTAPARADDACAPWPGEFRPLPRVDDADPLRARWARGRAERLAELALEREERDQIESNRLWQRVLCFDAGSSVARAGVERTRPRVVLRLAAPPPADPVSVAKPAAPPEPKARAAATPRPVAAPPRLPAVAAAKPVAAPEPPPLAVAVAVAKPIAATELRAPAALPVAAPDLRPLNASLERAEAKLREAHFEEALSELRTLRGHLVLVGDRPLVSAQRVRLEVLTATAHVAYGDEAAARECLRRALALEPRLDLDPSRTPPKVRRALEAARSEAQP